MNLQDLYRYVELIKGYPWLVLLLLAAPVVAVARYRRVYPARRMLYALAVPTGLSLLLLWLPDLGLVVGIVDLLVLVVAAFDLLTLPGARSFEVERQCTRIASLNKPHLVHLMVSNLTNWPWSVAFRDDAPDEFEQTPAQFEFPLQPRSRVTANYQLRSRRRGAFRLETVYLRVDSRLKWWRRYFEFPVESNVHVYPDLQQLSEYAVLARTNRLSLLGVRRTRKMGQDNEFERLRDYTPDDNYKHVDWRATARRNKLTVKDFQMNQSQRLVFLMDCGRMMTNTARGISLLDHAFNAMLMLSYVALRQGDSVGALCFSNRILAYVPPRGGMNQMNQLLHASFDRFPQLVESRFDEAFHHLSTHCKKRSLVILMTNLIDDVNANQVRQHLRSLTGRHLPLGVLMRDRSMFTAADATQLAGRALYRAAAAASILSWRQELIADLQRGGSLCVDTFPEDVTAPLVNRYLEIKARHLL